ncbi:hypothetical protein ACFL6W_02385 [Thermodesulfobacteriota bacterium]
MSQPERHPWTLIRYHPPSLKSYGETSLPFDELMALSKSKGCVYPPQEGYLPAVAKAMADR